VVKKHSNIKSPLRFSLAAASLEFAVDRKTLVKRLTEAQITPSESDGCYSCFQIFSALSQQGDIRMERLGKVRAEREYIELKNSRHRGEYLLRTEVLHDCAQAFMLMKQLILGNPIPQSLQHSLLEALRDLDITTQSRCNPEIVGPVNEKK
jgi:hypothetical protein